MDKQKDKKPAPSSPADGDSEQQNIWVKLQLTKYFGYIGIILLCLFRLATSKFGDWRPFGPQFMYPLISLKLEPTILKVILVFVTQTAIDHILYPNFNKSYEGENLKGYENQDIAINAGICVLTCAVSEIVRHLMKSKKGPTGEINPIYQAVACAAAIAAMLFGFNHFDIMYSPLSCYTQQEKITGNVTNKDQLSKEFACYPREILVQTDVMYLVPYYYLHLFSIGCLNAFFKFKEGKVSIEKIADELD